MPAVSCLANLRGVSEGEEMAEGYSYQPDGEEASESAYSYQPDVRSLLTCDRCGYGVGTVVRDHRGRLVSGYGELQRHREGCGGWKIVGDLSRGLRGL
jgi:hypothetical protein